jgi:hypothetical protein
MNGLSSLNVTTNPRIKLLLADFSRRNIEHDPGEFWLWRFQAPAIERCRLPHHDQRPVPILARGHLHTQLNCTHAVPCA